MIIKRIEIIGFKSFSDKTVLRIEDPITAVVGPNGCGKSNIIDAIRWCMGEQSAKHLRGKAMEDVIFGGSDTRGPGGMAEVSLTFESVAWKPAELEPEAEIETETETETVAGTETGTETETVAETVAETEADTDAKAIDFSQYGEVVVTRRLFRDGNSEYLINKTACRLRDITDFFLGTGVGTKAYSIIEQGRVGMIVSAKPEDRRLLLEEAAGITKFKKKKQAAERRMEMTRQNLLRVSDIVGEIDKRLGSLRRQAQKAERYRKYRAEVKDIELWSASHRFLGLRAERGLAAAAFDDTAARRDQARAELESREAAVAGERAECAVEERRLSDLTQTLFEVENRLRLGESQASFQAREASELDERSRAARGDIEGLVRQREEARADLARAGAEVIRLDAETAARAHELSGLEEAQQAARGRVQTEQGQLDEARAAISKAQADIARAEGNQRALERRRADLELRSGRMAEEEKRSAARHEELVGEITVHDERLAALKQTRVDVEQQKRSLEARMAELKGEQAQSEAQVETLRTELHRRRSRLVSLREIQDRYEGFQRGTRAVMQRRRVDDSIRCLVADVVQAPAEYEPAVEAVLGDRLGSILVDSHQASAEAVEFLKRRAEGRSSFIPLGEVNQASEWRRPVPARGRDPQGEFSEPTWSEAAGASEPDNNDAAAIEVIDVQSAQGVRGPMLGFIQCADEYRRVADYLFGDVVVVESLERALELWQEGLRRTLVTLDGDLVDRHGVVTGGSREGGLGVLGQKREMRELEEISSGLESDLAEATQRHVRGKAELASAGAALDVARRELHQAEIGTLALDKDLARARGEAARLNERLTQLAGERAEIDAALAEATREGGETRATEADARRRAGEAEGRQLQLIEGVTLAREALDEANARVTEHKVRVAQVGAEQRAARGQLGRLEEHERELGRRIERLERTLSEAAVRVGELRDEAEKTKTDVARLREERRLRADELSAARTAYEARTAALSDAELAVRQVRLRADKLTGEAGALDLKLHDLDGARRHLEETIAERYRLELARELFDHHLRPPVTPADEARLGELRELIERMGEINLTAIEECAELTTRFDFLTAQKKDLESALAQLEQAIARIHKTSRKRFKETFDAVNAKFQEVFPRLFRGGHAELRLVSKPGDSGDDLLDAGVEIFAQPPGKKNVSIDLLSGGEKALTAVSLIFSIFLIKPSPFCILDEVDAPLDEANVNRYNELVREMTSHSQFIVITHNKRTMEIADSLYGVTMEEPGCSKLVGVNLRSFERKAA